jgi:RNA polymerase sigma-70 factor (ECF subfamily)
MPQDAPDGILPPRSPREEEDAKRSPLSGKAAHDAADDEDVRLAGAGNRSAFDRLVLRHQDDVVNAAFYYLNHYEDAVEAAQEAFLKAYQSLASFRFESTFKTWILKIALNTARTLRARARAKKRSATVVSIERGVGAAPGGRDAGERGVDVADPNTSGAPSSLLERKEVKEALEAAIASLDEESREIIVLRDIAGVSYEAITVELGIPLGTVKSRVHRARLELRKSMERFL